MGVRWMIGVALSVAVLGAVCMAQSNAASATQRTYQPGMQQQRSGGQQNGAGSISSNMNPTGRTYSATTRNSAESESARRKREQQRINDEKELTKALQQQSGS